MKFIKNIYPFGFKFDLKILTKNAIPLVLTNLNTFMLPVICLLFCGHIGTDELAAVSLAVNLINVCGLANAHGFSSACDTLFPQLYGSKNKKNLGIALQKSLIIIVITSFPSMGLILNSKNLMILLKQKKEIIMLLDEFMIIYMPSVLFYGISVVLSRYAQCQNCVYPILVIYFIVNGINSALHALFLYYYELGVKGSAIALTISNFLLPVFIILYIFFISKLHIETWPGWSWKCLDDWKTYFKLAIPGFLMLLIEWLSYEIGTILCSLLDTVDLGAQSIAQQILVLIYMMPFGIGAAGNIHIGQLLGSNKALEAQNAYRVVFTMTTVTVLITVIVILCTSNYVAYAFTSDPEVIKLTSNVLILISFVHIFDAFQGMFSGIIKAVGAQFYGAIMSFIGFYLIGLPLGLSLMLKTYLKVFGFWIGILTGIFVLSILQIIYTYRLDWKKEAFKAAKRVQFEEKKDDEITHERLILNGDTINNNNIIDVKFEKRKLCKLILKRVFLCLLLILGSLGFIFTRNFLKISSEPFFNK